MLVHAFSSRDGIRTHVWTNPEFLTRRFNRLATRLSDFDDLFHHQFLFCFGLYINGIKLLLYAGFLFFYFFQTVLLSCSRSFCFF